MVNRENCEVSHSHLNDLYSNIYSFSLMSQEMIPSRQVFGASSDRDNHYHFRSSLFIENVQIPSFQLQTDQ